LGSLDRPGEQTDPADGSRDHPSGPDRRSRGETEAEAAERLGLSNLTRGDYYDSQRAAAEAQEAAIKRRDAARDQTADEPEQRLEEPRSYWTEVPRFLSMWQRLADRWPRRDGAETGSPVTERDRPYDVDSQRRAEALDAVAELPRAEPTISDAVKKAETENVTGGWLQGFECRLKGSGRLMEKALEALEAEPSRDPRDVVGKIPDAIRYTFCFEAKNYAEGYWDIGARLQDRGFEMYHSRNWWADPEYKGINTRWITSEGRRFEVQFHTSESFHAKHVVTHGAYERLRDPSTTEGERRDLREYQREVSSWIPLPAGATDIADHRRRA
jgi:hypothetical protein